ncbi:hypothetical protein F3Y22_tig00110652pilonHSYRG00098 [Hibiscus syriacus]|uniref:Uncharacterized protein n=1 Tax=Hibiscus syriacus TaxID=106335 RepID=A0A6A2ZYR8_HIBSY|nr:hypothetical protein F3Y22_tig00110652pilonHSYRG00098 [Hibiscus syriacus]
MVIFKIPNDWPDLTGSTANKEKGSTNKRSGKVPTKGLTSKERVRKRAITLGFRAFGKIKVQQTDSTHHLEPSGFGLGWMNPIIPCPQARSRLWMFWRYSRLTKIYSYTFSRILRWYFTTFSWKPNFQGSKITKSGSFPMPHSPRTGYLRSTTLDTAEGSMVIPKGRKICSGCSIIQVNGRNENQQLFSEHHKEANSSSQGSDSQGGTI